MKFSNWVSICAFGLLVSYCARAVEIQDNSPAAYAAFADTFSRYSGNLFLGHVTIHKIQYDCSVSMGSAVDARKPSHRFLAISTSVFRTQPNGTRIRVFQKAHNFIADSESSPNTITSFSEYAMPDHPEVILVRGSELQTLLSTELHLNPFNSFELYTKKTTSGRLAPFAIYMVSLSHSSDEQVLKCIDLRPARRDGNRILRLPFPRR